MSRRRSGGEIAVRGAALGGAYASAAVGLYALATAGPVGPVPLVVLGGSLLLAAVRLRRASGETGSTAPVRRFTTGLGTFLVALAVVPAHIAVSGSWVLGAIDLLVLVQANRLLALRDPASTGQVLVIAILMLMGAAVLTLNFAFLGSVLLLCLAGTWTAIFRVLWVPGREGADGRVPRAVAVAALLAGCVVFAGTCLLFAILPRIQISAFRGGLLEAQSVSGFSEEVELGELGSVMIDTRPVMRVSLSDPGPPEPELYWRGIALDTYENGRWSVSDASEERIVAQRLFRGDRPRAAGFPLREPPDRGRASVAQEVTLEPIDLSVLFGLPGMWYLEADLPLVAVNSTDSYFYRARSFGRMAYTVHSAPPTSDPRRLDGAAAVEPAGAGGRYLQIPDRLRAAIEPLARELSLGKGADAGGSDFRRARRIEAALQTWTYSLVAPPDGAGTDPVERFLLETRTGWCEQYASGMVLLLRALGIPARMANGFHGGERNEFGNYWLVRRSDAHSWVEVPFAGEGWVRFDPTPGQGGASRVRSNGWIRAFDSLRRLWIQRVVEYNLLDQFAILKEAGRRADRMGDRMGSLVSTGPGRLRRLLGGGTARLAFAVIAAAAIAVVLRRRAVRGSGRLPSDEAERWWRDAERRFRRRGIIRRAGETALELARRAGKPAWAEAFYLARFAGRELRSEEQSAVEAVRREIREDR